MGGFRKENRFLRWRPKPWNKAGAAPPAEGEPSIMHLARLEVAAIYVGLNILILFVLSYLVIAGRRKHKIVLGTGENRDFERAVRAHGNAAEYIPAALVGLVVAAFMEPAAPAWVLHGAGLSLTIGRILHGIGLHTSALNAGRMIGMVLTWVAYLILGFGLIFAALAQQL